jgi:hypothetical protein
MADDQVERMRGKFTATSGWRQDLINQLIVFSFEWVNDHDALQSEAILQIFGHQVPYARALSRSP